MNDVISSVVIANGQSLSGEVDLTNFDLVGVIMPSAWTAAALTFSMSDVTGGTAKSVRDSAGAEVSYTVAADQYIIVNQAHRDAFAGFLKLRSGTAGVPVAQGAARTIQLVLRPRV